MDAAKATEAPRGQRTKRGATTIRRSAAERRNEVLQAAITEFAQGGYAGTSTEAIAKRAGISQPYLFRLFGSKKELFGATMGVMHRRIEDAFRAAADGLTGVDALVQMGEAYEALLGERDLLLLQLHSFAGSSDPDIRAASRMGFRQLWMLVAELTGLEPSSLRPFFAQGMLMNVLAAIDAPGLDETWAQLCTADPEEMRRGLQESIDFRSRLSSSKS